METDEYAEMPLWRILDEHGFQFRRTYRELVAQHALPDRDPWNSDARFAGFRQERDLIDGLTLPMHFVYYEGSELSDNIPRRMNGSIRQSKNEYENYKIAVDQLTKLFGTGQEASDLSSESQTWTFGDASVVARIFPRDRNKPDPHNDRHRLDPDSITECSLTVETAYCPEPSPDELDAITNVQMMEASADLPLVKHRPAWSEYTRRLRLSPWSD